MTGLIMKGIGGFYYVQTEAGLIEAKGRGIFRKDGMTLAVGDFVDMDIIDETEKKGVINEILPRKNQFIRPPIVNVDIFLIICAATRPKPNFALIDKFLVMAEMHNVEAVLCINKCDEADEEEIATLKEAYAAVYPVLCVSGRTGEGMEQLETIIAGKTAALAGPSGVGKSTMLNAMIPHANMQTGAISEKTKRGRHTTRHVELFEVEGGGKVFDTPGFTSFEIMEAGEDNLRLYYPEIERYEGQCRYDNCRHITEPDCAVREAVKNGEIPKQRYESYAANIEEIRGKKKY